MSNQYVFNHDVHRENVPLVKSIIQELETNEKYYKSELDSLRKPNSDMLLTDIALENLLNKFHQVVIQLRDRYDDRDTLDVTDEYDVQDLLHSFSCRLYGLRKYKKQIERDVEIAKELQDGNKSDNRTEIKD